MKLSRISLFVFPLLTGAAVLAAQEPTPVAPPAPTASVGTGFDYSRGKYGFATNTEVFSVPLNLGYDTGPWTLNLNLSYLTLKGPATVIAGTGAARPTSASQSGVGDVYASLTHHFGAIIGDINVDATGRVKIPTANESRGLGTGKTDYYGEITFSRTIDTVTPFATAGYRVLGDSAIYQLRDGLYASAGAHFRVSPESVVTALVNWRQPIQTGSDHSIDAMVMFTHDVSASWRFSVYALKGFTDASPDIGAGLQLTRRF